MKKRFSLTLILILIGSTIYSSEKGWDVFNEENCESATACNTEGLITSIVDGKVSVISGEYLDAELDCCLAGPEPLKLQRSYSSQPAACMSGIDSFVPMQGLVHIGPRYCNWQFNYLTTVFFQSEADGHVKHLELSAFIPNHSYAAMRHQSTVSSKNLKDNDCKMPLIYQKGLSNCSSGHL